MGNGLSKAALTQSFWIPKPTLTEQNLPDQQGRVVIVTGGYAGIGEKLVQILYGKGANVYIAGRSASKASNAIDRIKAAEPNAAGKLTFLQLDLADLTSIKKSADDFLAKESRLDVLVNNAGVMWPAAGSKTSQDHDLQFGTNLLGPHLFTKLLHPILKQTAASSPPNSVRILWASSLALQLSPPNGIQFDGPGQIKDRGTFDNYAQTKVGNTYLGIQTQRILRDAGVISTSFNPGNLYTELQRNSAMPQMIWKAFLAPAIYGAYTELWAGWSEDVTLEKNISLVIPWGRDGTPIIRTDIRDAIDKQDYPEKTWQYCEEQTKQYAQ